MMTHEAVIGSAGGVTEVRGTSELLPGRSVAREDGAPERRRVAARTGSNLQAGSSRQSRLQVRRGAHSQGKGNCHADKGAFDHLPHARGC